MSDAQPDDVDDASDEMLAKVSDYLDGTLTGADKEAVAAKIANDPTWKQTHDEMVETRKFISGMRKAKAPEEFAEKVEQRIHKRSAGRFFARRTLGDRVPFGALLIVAVLVLCVIGYVMWASQTGSLKVEKAKPPTEQKAAPVTY